MQVAALRYSHRFGTDVLVVQLNGDYLPKITNDLLESLGVLEPDVQNLEGDEDAEWYGPFDVTSLPIVDGWVKVKK